MNPKVMRFVVRTRFRLTTRNQADGWIRKAGGWYLKRADGLAPDQGRNPVHVPEMLGVDPDMRNWSYFMLLEHNAIVSRRISAVTRGLATGTEPAGLEGFDPKKDVMPSADPGIEQVENFRDSIDEHLEGMKSLKQLRGTSIRPHPVFGDFDAHSWHCMLGFHLQIHMKQARFILGKGQ